MIVVVRVDWMFDFVFVLNWIGGGWVVIFGVFLFVILVLVFVCWWCCVVFVVVSFLVSVGVV